MYVTKHHDKPSEITILEHCTENPYVSAMVPQIRMS